MAKADYYELLGVARNASDDEIKKAYRVSAMKYHPDRQHGKSDAEKKAAEEQFKAIQEAYDVLSDERKRSAYDQFGHTQMGGGFGQGGGEYRDFSEVFGDIFGDIFGGRRGGASGRPTAQPGADLRYEMALTLEQAVKGTTVEITIPALKSCTECSGSGMQAGTKATTCTTCEGMGQVRMQQGFFTVQQTCPNCHGKGKIITNPCKKCRGHGRVRDSKKLSVKIPAGVDTGDRIRLSGEGEAGEAGAPPGDLYVEVHVKEHAIFKRDGNDLHCEMPIGFTLAALGGEIEVPTLDGRVNLKIPAETQTGKSFRLRGKGVKSVRGKAVGDLLCHVFVETPVNLSRRQKELFKELQTEIDKTSDQHNPRSRSWLDNIKRFFDELRA